MPNLISVHQFICLFLLSIFVLHLSVYFLNPPYLRVIFEIGIAVALFILITIIALRISTKEEKKVKKEVKEVKKKDKKEAKEAEKKAKKEAKEAEKKAKKEAKVE